MMRNDFGSSSGSQNNFVSPEDSMFEASFDEENIGNNAFGTEFYSNPLDENDWDLDRSFPEEVISPSALSSFTTPRKSFPHNFADANDDPSPRIIMDGTPFQSRFASAAIVSQHQSARARARKEVAKNLFHSHEMATPNQSFERPLSEKSQGPLSPNPNDSYISFGDQSVFSDITESEMSTSVINASRDLRRKARESKKSTSPRQQLGKVIEDDGDNRRKETQSKLNDRKITKSRDRLMDYTKSEELSSEGGKKISKRLASFFANRSASRPRNAQDEVQVKSEGKNSNDRSLSVPNNRLTKEISSPSRSDNSGSSGGYVGWPGTLDRNGNTVEDNSSQTSGEDIESPAQALSRRHITFAEKMAEKKEKESLARQNLKTRSSPLRLRESESEVKKSATLAVNTVRSKVADLKRQFERVDASAEEIADLDTKPTIPAKHIVDLDVSPIKEPKPSDYHLAAALAKAGISPVSNQLNTSHGGIIETDQDEKSEAHSLNHSFPGALGYARSPLTERPANQKQIDTSASLRRVQSAGIRVKGLNKNKTDKYAFSSSSRHQIGPARLSEAALRQQDRLSSTFQSVAHGANVKGYRGFINKTTDVPNLMDDESVTSASTMASNVHLKSDDESDVFDGVSSDKSCSDHTRETTDKHETIMQHHKNLYAPRQEYRSIGVGQTNVVHIKSSLASIQTTQEAFDNRRTAAEFDSALTESDTDYALNIREQRDRPLPSSIAPGLYDEMITQKRIMYDSSDSAEAQTDSESKYSSINGTPYYDLSKFAIKPSQIRKLVKVYRNLSQHLTNSSVASIEEEEGKTAFALFEMRSRIMETDIERGFDRAGGTVTVDDIVLTSYYKASCRVRDAVIVSKAWRDGASPQDARTALNLTRPYEYYVKRSSRLIISTDSMVSDYQESIDSNCSHIHVSHERVGWIDDTEFSLVRCFGPKTLRGFNIFTVGDCRSMLLKLTHENCENLKKELNEASSRQTVAEQLMGNDGDDSLAMTDAELEYLESMEDVKVLANNLVYAQRAFDMVKSEIENQVQKLEHILERIDNESANLSSYDSAAGSDIGDDDSDTSGESQYAKEKLTRRVQRAELNAEVAMKEAQIAKAEADKSKKEAERIRLEKEKELEDLQAKLQDLEAKSSIMLSDFEAKLKSQSLLKTNIVSLNDDSLESATGHQSLLYAASTVSADPDQNEAKERIKARFRQRRMEGSQKPVKEQSDIVRNTAGKQKLSGQVHQRLEFYERSLQAVGA